jgi:dihydroceramidase
MFMYLAYKGISNCLREGHDTVFLISYLGYLVVGTGSFFFHSTLKYQWQLVDELSMIYTTCIAIYASMTRTKSATSYYAVTMGLSLTALALTITAYYHYVEDPVFHQISYALLTAALLFRSVYIMEAGIRPRFREAREAKKALLANAANGSGNGDAVISAEELARQNARDAEIIRTMWIMIPTGLSIFLGGFGIWGLDRVYCSQFRAWRREIGLPWGILLEGHGWW